MATLRNSFRQKTFAADRIATLRLSRNQRGLHRNLPEDLPQNMALPVLVLPAVYALAREVVGTASHQAETSVTAFETISFGRAQFVTLERV
jgi:hypothetical protein